MPIRTVGFDADDTLWHNERHYQEMQSWFASLLAPYVPDAAAIGDRLYATERANLRFYG